MTTALGTTGISDGWQEVDDIGSVRSLSATEEGSAPGAAAPAKDRATTADAPTQTEPEVKWLPAVQVANPAWTSTERTRAAVGSPSEAGPSSLPPTEIARSYLPKDPPAIHEALKALYSSLGALETAMYSSTASWSGTETMISIGTLNTVVEDLREQARSLMRPVYMCSRLWRARGHDLDNDIPLNASIGEWMASVDKNAEEAHAALQFGGSVEMIPAVDASTAALRELYNHMQEFLPVFLVDLDNYRTGLVERSSFPDHDDPVAPMRRLRNMDPRLASARQEFYRLSDAVQGVGSILRGFLADEVVHSNSVDLGRIKAALEQADSIAALVTTAVSCHAAEWDGQREVAGMMTYEEFVEVNQPMLADVSAQLEQSVREIEAVFDDSAENDVREVLRRGQLVVLLQDGRLEGMMATLEFVEGVIMPGKGHLEF